MVGPRPGMAARGYGVLAVAFGVGGLALYFSLHPMGVTVSLGLVGALIAAMFVARGRWLLILPAALPIVDLAPWTGQIYVTESDALVFAVLFAVGLRQVFAPLAPAAVPQPWRMGPLQSLLIFAMSASYALSLWHGLPLPLADDGNLLVSYYGPMNGLRVAKGFVFALALLPFLSAEFRHDADAAGKRLVIGLLLGLAGVVIAGAWERVAFPGFANFTSDYRITALFWEMNVGGATLDGWLALSLPFLFWTLFRQYSTLRLALGLAFVALALYVVFSTFSRGLYMAVIVSLLLILTLNVAYATPSSRFRGRSVAVVGVVAGVAILLVAIFGTYYSATRMARVTEDFSERRVHWGHSMAFVQTPLESVLGIGVGRFPDKYFWNVPEALFPGSYRIETEGSESFLRLSGPRIGLDYAGSFRVSQRMVADILPPLRVSFRARSRESIASVFVEVCHKLLLYSRGCTETVIRVPRGDDWSAHELTLPGDDVPAGRSAWSGPNVFSIINGTRAQVLDIDGISVTDARGQELLANREFVAGTQRWFFSSDHHHLPWHAKNLWLHYYVEQGWIGLFAFLALSVGACVRLALGNARCHPLAIPVLAGLIGFQVVGVFDSLVDAPRLALPFFLLIFLALGLRLPLVPEKPRDIPAS